MPDGVVWLPMRSPGSDVRGRLGTGPGGVVRLAAGTPDGPAPRATRATGSTAASAHATTPAGGAR
jgi:NADH-quinone oxidoreductase subunit G